MKRRGGYLSPVANGVPEVIDLTEDDSEGIDKALEHALRLCVCKLCNASYGSLSLYRRHLLTAHSARVSISSSSTPRNFTAAPDYPYVCRLGRCLKKFRHRVGLTSHYETEHLQLIKRSCPVQGCGASLQPFVNQDHLLNHISKKHGIADVAQLPSATPSRASFPNQTDLPPLPSRAPPYLIIPFTIFPAVPNPRHAELRPRTPPSRFSSLSPQPIRYDMSASPTSSVSEQSTYASSFEAPSSPLQSYFATGLPLEDLFLVSKVMMTPDHNSSPVRPESTTYANTLVPTSLSPTTLPMTSRLSPPFHGGPSSPSPMPNSSEPINDELDDNSSQKTAPVLSEDTRMASPAPSERSIIYVSSQSPPQTPTSTTPVGLRGSQAWRSGRLLEKAVEMGYSLVVDVGSDAGKGETEVHVSSDDEAEVESLVSIHKRKRSLSDTESRVHKQRNTKTY